MKELDVNEEAANLTLGSGAMERFEVDTYHLFTDGRWKSTNSNLGGLEQHTAYTENSLIVLSVVSKTSAAR